MTPPRQVSQETSPQALRNRIGKRSRIAALWLFGVIALHGQALPAISSVVNGASFQSGIVSGSWATIAGTHLSPVSDTWEKSIVDGKLPTTLGGVTVSIGGKPAFLYSVSPTQINLQVPDIAVGFAPVVVTTPAGVGTGTGSSVAASPAFFQWTGKFVTATRRDYSLATRNGSISGVVTVPAKPGDVIILWGTGFGLTNPAFPPGTQVPSDKLYSVADPVTVTIGGTRAVVYGAALSPGSAGLYQVAVHVPDSLIDGDWPVRATIGGVESPENVTLAVQRQAAPNSCSFPLVTIQTGSDSSCKGGSIHFYPVGMPTAGCHGWRANDTTGRQHDNSASNIRCNGDGTFSFDQYAGNLTCSGTGVRKIFTPNSCQQDIPPSLFSVPVDLTCCTAPGSAGCKSGVPSVGVAGASIFLNNQLCVQ